MITAEIIADSLSPAGTRMATFMLTFPRWILAEINTHRALSKSAASSRAISFDKFVDKVIYSPALPVKWGTHQKGMQSGPALEGRDADVAEKLWLKARNAAITYAQDLNDLGVHKSITNRLLEPWFMVKMIISGTDFENFFALRAHEDAQPEFQDLAFKMLQVYNESNPKSLKEGEWHIPFGDKIDEKRILEDLVGESSNLKSDKNNTEWIKLKIAIARCARLSYFNYEGKDDYQADLVLCDKLFGSTPRHLSPTEHVAQALSENVSFGNLKGFKQWRYFFDDQNLKDPRVIKKDYLFT